VWLQNRLPNKGNAWRIPYDEVFGKLPDLSFVRVFGSQAYAFVDPSLRKKLAPRAKDMLYVGHQEHGSHYMLLDTTNNKVYLTGKPVIRERFDEIGRRLAASDGPTLQELVVFEDGEPSPFAVEMPPAFPESPSLSASCRAHPSSTKRTTRRSVLCWWTAVRRWGRSGWPRQRT
jgi:hypothetical protein